MPAAPAAPAATPASRASEVAGLSRPFKYNELIGKHGGLTALHFAARQGAADTVRVLVEGGADLNQRTAGDRTTPMVIAAVNGHYDLVLYLLEKGADPTLMTDAGMTPLYAVLNVEWAPKSFYPQPRAYQQQKANYLQVMTALLDKGADPNARLGRTIWYTQYNFDLLRVEDGGATPFWRAAYASDIEAMKLLVARGADPTIPTMRPAVNDRFRQGGVRGGDESRDHSGLPPVPTAGPDIPPLLAAAGAGYGEGFAGNAHRFAATGMLAAVKYLIEEVGTDPNVRDSDGHTAVHHAASRGDNAMISYLVSKGADVTLLNRRGQTTVDMANGPVQRVQPYPETIKLLEGLGAKNNHKCVSC
jgi:ankyrin repeat protein